MVDIYMGYYDPYNTFTINGALVNGFDYDEYSGQLMFRYFSDAGVMAVADIDFPKSQWRKIARCKRERFWEKLKNLFGDE